MVPARWSENPLTSGNSSAKSISTDHAMKNLARISAWTIVQGASGALVVLALGAAGAQAASAVKDGSYHGALSGSQAKVMISFRVTGGGSEVRSLRLSSRPMYCGGRGAPGAPKIIFPTIKISAGGTFAGSGKDLVPAGPLKGSVLATLHVSGRFAGEGKESGTITTAYSGPAKKCSGHSSYTAVG
jgi:hypothetical protein